jgi:hypothetical protein
MSDEKKVEPVEFKSEVKRISIDAEECNVNRLGVLVRDIPFTDYSKDPPEQLIFEARMTPVSMADRKAFIKKCTTNDRAGIPEIDFDRLDDLLMAKVFGFNEAQWKQFITNHPIGLYTKLALISKEINGESTLTSKQIEELKNLAGQEQ